MTRKMKDSGIEWIGEIPEDWIITTFNKLFTIKAGGDLKKELFSFEQTIVHAYPIYTNAVKAEYVYGYTKIPFFKENSITVTGRGEIGYAIYRNHKYDAIIRLLVLEPKNKYNCKFYAYYINGALTFPVESSAINQLSAQQLAPYKICVPSIKEQLRITKFLDKKCNVINLIIKNQKKLIEKLKEYKQSIITELIIKGLDPNVPCKNSGIEWIGKIPKHWKAIKIKYLLKDNGIKIGPFGSALTSNEIYESGDIKVYGQANLIRNDFSYGEKYITINKFEELKVYEIYSNDILISMMGTIGKCSIFPEFAERGIMDSHLTKMTLNKEIVNIEYFNIFFNDTSIIEKYLQKISKGSIMSGLNSTILKNISIILPPIEEQNKLVIELNKKRNRIDAMISNKEQLIEKLVSYKKSLIYECVTGKREVQ